LLRRASPRDEELAELEAARYDTLRFTDLPPRM